MHRPQRRSHRIALGGSVMQAAVVPAVSSSWQVKDVPQPQPGPNQVLVKMHASGICYTDVHQTLGHLPGPFPRILGHEPVGEIVGTAPDVTARKVGDRVGSACIQSTCGAHAVAYLPCGYVRSRANDLADRLVAEDSGKWSWKVSERLVHIGIADAACVHLH